MRATWVRRLAVLTLAAVMALGGVASGAPVLFPDEGALDNSTSRRTHSPEISGSEVVWTVVPFTGDTTHYVNVYNLASDSSTTIGLNDGYNQFSPDLSLERVAFVTDAHGNDDVRVRDMRTLEYDTAAETTADEQDPRIDGNLVAWWVPAANELRYWDIGRNIRGDVPGSSGTVSFDVDNGRIVWTKSGLGGTSAIYFFEPGVSDDAELILNGTDDIDYLTVHGNWVSYSAWEDDLAVDSWDARFVELGGYVREAAAGSFYNEWRSAVFHHDTAWDTDQGGSYDVMFAPMGGDITNVAGDNGIAEYDASMFGRKIVYAMEMPMADVDIWMTWASPEVDRTEGDNRFLTAIETSKAYFEDAENAVLCTAYNFPDALSAAPLARMLRGPLLLTMPDEVDAATMAELDRLGVDNVYVIGGADVVSNNVMSQITSELSAGCTRIYGDDRYATSVAIANYMANHLVDAFAPEQAFFARGDNFPDALALGPVASSALSPILLVRPGEVPAVVADAVADLGITSGFIAGGSDVVSDIVKSELAGLMIANGGDDTDPNIVTRWAGDTRYETAIAVVEGGLANRWVDLDTLGFATGYNFPDALGGGAALGWYGGALLLSDASALPGSVETFLEDHEYEIGRADFFGGTDVVSDAVKDEVSGLLK